MKYSNQSNIEETIRQAFESYRSALLSNDGEKALAFVDSGTVNYYETAIHLAKTANKQELLQLTAIELYFVLVVRHRIPKPLALTMDGRDFFVYAVTEDWIDKDSLMSIEIKTIQIIDSIGLITLYDFVEQEESKLRFIYEQGCWKIDLTSGMPQLNQMLKVIAKALSFINAYDKAILWIFRLFTDKKVSKSIWEPLSR